MEETNPYQPPKAALSGALVADGNCWREGKRLVARGATSLPPRCIKCGATASMPMQERTFYWHSPWLYLLLPVNILIYAIVASIVRKRVTLTVGLCGTHVSHRARALLGSVGGVLLGLVLLVVGLDRHLAMLATVAGVVLIAAIVVGMLYARTLLPTRIDGDIATFKGCGSEFLALLPTAQGHR